MPTSRSKYEDFYVIYSILLLAKKIKIPLIHNKSLVGARTAVTKFEKLLKYNLKYVEFILIFLLIKILHVLVL